MKSSLEAPAAPPKLPKLPFLAADAALMLTALFIGICSGTPLDPVSGLAIALLIGAGTAIAIFPFWADYVRKYEADALARQKELDALSRDIAGVATRVDAAIASQHTFTENARFASSTVEQLPQRLQEILLKNSAQLDELIRQRLAASENKEMEILRAEIARLRSVDTTQTEKLQAILPQITAATETFATASTTFKQLCAQTETATAQLRAAIEENASAAETAAGRAQTTLLSLDESAQQLRAAADALASAASTLAETAIAPVAPATPAAAAPLATENEISEPDADTTPPITVPTATGNGSAGTRTRLGRGLRSLIAGATPENTPPPPPPRT